MRGIELFGSRSYVLTVLIEPLHIYKISSVLRLKGARTGSNEEWLQTRFQAVGGISFRYIQILVLAHFGGGR